MVEIAHVFETIEKRRVLPSVSNKKFFKRLMEIIGSHAAAARARYNLSYLGNVPVQQLIVDVQAHQGNNESQPSQEEADGELFSRGPNVWSE